MSMWELPGVTWSTEHLSLPFGSNDLKNFQADPLEEYSYIGCNKKPDRQYKLVINKTEIIGLCDNCVIMVRKQLSVAVLLEEIDRDEAIAYSIMTA